VHIHIQGTEALARWGVSPDDVCDVIARIVNGAGSQLVVVLYVLPGSGWSGECHYSWFRPEGLHRGELPRLPDRFRLIQIAMGENTYPYEAPDAFGWHWRFETFLDHLAAVTAHEVFHLCQPSFSVQRTRNEHDANQAALDQVRELGFAVAAQRPERGVRR
jgi:hypothetical protein